MTDIQIQGQLALVTGASRGIGAAIAIELARRGMKVIGTATTDEGAAHISNTLAAYPGCAGKNLNVTDAAGIEALIDSLVKEHGGIQVLVNNAGIQTWSSLMDLDVADWDRVMATNLRGTFLNTRTAARAMQAAGQGGSILTLGSGCNTRAFPRLVDYTASKGGIEQFTKVAACELGPFGIRVNCIAPGAIATERTASEAGDYAGTWAPITPLRRIGTPQDLVGPMLFLISDAAAFVTAQTLYVDGGTFSQAPWPYPT
jgi:NAD(P)-dependent dehydrogenase (short-subunit alcohol dehydrogenase family)